MKNLSILLIEPSPVEAGLLSPVLARQDLKVVYVSGVPAALEILQSTQPVHLILANWAQLANGGIEMAEALHRKARLPIPLVVYSRSFEAEDRQAQSSDAIELMLDFPMPESGIHHHLLQVLRARHPWAFPHRLVMGDLELDRESFSVVRRGKRVHLTLSEFQILEVLIRNVGKVLTREEIHAAYTTDPVGNIRVIDVHIKRLKQALTMGGSPPPIRAIRGKGYKMYQDG